MREREERTNRRRREREGEREMFSHGGKAEIPSSVGSKRAKEEDGRVVEGELKLG